MDKIIYNNIFQIIYLFFPLLFVLILGIFKYFKDSVKIRRLCKGLFVFETFALFLWTIFKTGDFFEIGRISFSIQNYEFIFLYLINVGFLLFLSFSKSFIKISKKIFYLSFILLFFFLNLFIISNNIIFSLLCLLYIMLTGLVVTGINFRYISEKLKINTLFKFDFIVFFIAVAFIFGDFLRYFILNDISANYSGVQNYFQHINKNAIELAFFGFLILILKQFGFLNLIRHYSKLSAQRSFYISSLIIFTESTTAISLLFKVCNIFYQSFIEYQLIITMILVINIIYHTLILFKNNNLAHSFNSIYIISVCMGLFGIYSKSAIESSVLLYYFVVLLISYILLLFVFAVLEKKFNTKNISDFKKINDKTRNIQLLALYALLNFAKLPVGANFFAFLFLCMMISSLQFNSRFMNITLYVILICTLISGIYIFDLISKILIEPLEPSKNKIELLTHQKIVLYIIAGLLILLLFGFQNLIRIFNYSHII